MTRLASYFLGPEVAAVACGIAVYWFCQHHHSGESRDVRLLEGLLWITPPVLTTAVFLTIFVPGAKSWAWLIRVNLAFLSSLCFCGYQIVASFGDGAKGQDVGFYLAIILGIILGSMANAITGGMVLAAQRPALAEWLRSHPFLGGLGVLLAALPIGVVLVVALVLALIIAMIIHSFR
ncbi:MAG: hypothetical protein U1G07_08240 [Verrucomicrobiota bacterium]